MIDKVQFLIDGYPVEDNVIEEFGLRNHSRNLRYSSTLKSEVLDFVGFIINGERVLVSLPKHYVSLENLKSLNESDMSLIFKTLIKYEMNKDQDYIGEFEDYESSYPFKSFFDVYKHYLKYGLYQETISNTKPGYNGKIAWKDTIRKSQVIVNEKSLIFTPLYVKKTYKEQVFLTECMVYVINKTVDRFSMFLNLKSITGVNVQTELFDNKGYVITRLQALYTNTFKDNEKKLIRALISFFKEVIDGGNLVIKHYNFELVWESMVGKYLNDYFQGIEDGLPVFDSTRNKGSKRFKKKSFSINKRNSKHKIELDHYWIEENKQYIFDSKYYMDLKRIDYKQIAYYSMLKSLVSEETFNILVIPTSIDRESKVYFELEERYYNRESDKISLIATQLNMKSVIENFIKNT